MLRKKSLTLTAEEETGTEPTPTQILFRALNQRNYRLAIVLIILAIIVPAAIFMAIVIHYNITDLSRGQVISFLAVGGIISFFIVAFIFSKFLADNFTMTFHNSCIAVQSSNTISNFDFVHLESFQIWNNSDYSKLIIRHDNQVIKYHVGFANLIKTTPILAAEDTLDIVFSPQLGFTKHIANQKGINIITYTT